MVKSCEWVLDSSAIVIKGFNIKRGFFYLGEAFPIYNSKRFLGKFDKNKNIRFIKELVIDPTLPISESKTRKVIVSSYVTMDPYQRFLYLKWLSGESKLSETLASLVVYYLWGISVRVFCDDECTKKEVDKITRYLKELRDECDTFEWKSKSIIVQKIEELQSYICVKYYPKRKFEYKKFEHIQQYLVMEKIAQSFPNTLNDAYDIWCECFSHDKNINRYSDTKKKEWWQAAYEIVKARKAQKSLCPKTLEFDLRHFGKGAGFCTGHIPLDSVITHYSKEGVDFYALIAKCHIEFYECYRKHRTGCLVDKSHNTSTRSKGKRIDLKKTNIVDGKSVVMLNDIVLNPIQKYVRDIKKGLSSDYQVISVADIMEQIGCNSPNPLIITTKLKVVYQSFFGEGIGMVPSQSYMNRYFQPEDKIIVFQRLPHEQYEPDYIYDFVDVFLKLAAYISQGSITDCERSFVQNFIATKDKRIGNQKQLYAYFLWYLGTIRTINTEIRQCVNNDLNAKGREAIAKHLVEYVESDFDTLFAKEHLLVNVVPILSSKPFKISDVKRNEALVTIDQNKLCKVKQDTHVAQSFLSDIFDDVEQEIIVKTAGFEHKAILVEILSKESWEREDLSNLCKQKGYILGSLLEEINDYSYSKVDDVVIEDDGNVLYVNTEYKKELL